MYAGKVKKEKNFSKSKKEEVFPNNKIGKNFSKAIDEVYNPVEEIINTKYEYIEDEILNTSSADYTFDDMCSIEKLLDSYFNGKEKKLSQYEAVRLCRILQFVCTNIKRIALTYEIPGMRENITPDNRIFFKYIANGKYEDIENEIYKLYELYFKENRKSKDAKKHQIKVEETFKLNKLNISEEVAEEIKKTYDAYNEEESKASANLKEKDIKKDAKTIKKCFQQHLCQSTVLTKL